MANGKQLLFGASGTICSVMLLACFQAAVAQAGIPPGQMAAARAGDTDAQYAVGGIYFQHQDYANACKWFQIAAARGSMAANSFMQVLNGEGHPCPKLNSSQAAAAQSAPSPDVRVFAAMALEYARDRWHPDAELTYVQIERTGAMSFTLVSPQARQVLSLSDGGSNGIVSPLTGNTIDVPLPHGFVDASRALAVARASGMRGNMDHAALMVYRGPANRPLAAWLISPVDGFRGYLVGALDGRLYPLKGYLEPVNGNDAQLRALATALAPKPAPAAASARGNGGCTVNRSLNFFDPCSRRSGGSTAARLEGYRNFVAHQQALGPY